MPNVWVIRIGYVGSIVLDVNLLSRESYSIKVLLLTLFSVEQEQNIVGLEYMQNIFFYVYKPVEANSELFGKITLLKIC